MPRSFLIANNRYGRSINNNCTNHDSIKHVFNDKNIKSSIQTNIRPITTKKQSTQTNISNQNEPSSFVIVKESSNLNIQQVNNHNNHQHNSFVINDDNDFTNNINVILNFTPPSTPFQSSAATPPTSVTGEIHTCSDCGKSYSTSSNLTRHRQTHRSITDKKARKCPHCDKIYVSMPAYSMHVRTHTQGCRCQFCGKCFSRPWLLQGHIRTHTGEKPFECHICKKSFADKSNLRAHVQIHSKIKPFICCRCGKGFALKSYLGKHEESSCMQRKSNSSNSRLKRKDQTTTTPTPTTFIISHQ